MNILIVEDELIIAEMMADQLTELGYHVVGKARNHAEGIEFLTTKKPDLALIDINLGSGKTGIDLANFIKEYVSIPYVFVTSNSDLSTLDEVKQSAPFGYLQKPFTKEGLFSAIEIALINYNRLIIPNKTQENSIKYIFVKEGHIYVKVALNELQFIKSDGNYLELHTPSKMHLVRSTMKEFSTKLPNNNFITTNRSFLVNKEKISRVGPNFVFVKDIKIPLSKQFKSDVFEFLNQ